MAGEAKRKAAATTVAKKNPAAHLSEFRWKPGERPAGAGRPKGSRNKLGEEFLQDMLAAWQERGKDAIDRVIKDRPHEFIKCVAGILPRELSVTTQPVQELSDDELAAALIALRSITALAGAGEGSEEAPRH